MKSRDVSRLQRRLKIFWEFVEDISVTKQDRAQWILSVAITGLDSSKNSGWVRAFRDSHLQLSKTFHGELSVLQKAETRINEIAEYSNSATLFLRVLNDEEIPFWSERRENTSGNSLPVILEKFIGILQSSIAKIYILENEEEVNKLKIYIQAKIKYFSALPAEELVRALETIDSSNWPGAGRGLGS